MTAFPLLFKRSLQVFECALMAVYVCPHICHVCLHVIVCVGMSLCVCMCVCDTECRDSSSRTDAPEHFYSTLLTCLSLTALMGLCITFTVSEKARERQSTQISDACHRPGWKESCSGTDVHWRISSLLCGEWKLKRALQDAPEQTLALETFQNTRHFFS